MFGHCTESYIGARSKGQGGTCCCLDKGVFIITLPAQIFQWIVTMVVKFSTFLIRRFAAQWWQTELVLAMTRQGIEPRFSRCKRCLTSDKRKKYAALVAIRLYVCYDQTRYRTQFLRSKESLLSTNIMFQKKIVLEFNITCVYEIAS